MSVAERGQGEKEFEPCLLFFTQFGFIVPTYLKYKVQKEFQSK
ncbi:MAG: hypothetical protein V7K20_08145 [Nostoc sp.]